MDANPGQSAELRLKLGTVADQAVGRTNGRLNVTREHRQHPDAMTAVRTWVALENAYTRFLRLGTGCCNLTNWLIKAKNPKLCRPPTPNPVSAPGVSRRRLALPSCRRPSANSRKRGYPVLEPIPSLRQPE